MHRCDNKIKNRETATARTNEFLFAGGGPMQITATANEIAVRPSRRRRRRRRFPGPLRATTPTAARRGCGALERRSSRAVPGNVLTRSSRRSPSRHRFVAAEKRARLASIARG